jgi:hypothetical protein
MPPDDPGSFFGAHWPFLIVAINVLVLLLTGVVGVLFKLDRAHREDRHQHQVRWQKEQDVRLEKLESSMSTLSGKQGVAKAERDSIAASLSELVRRFERAAEMMEKDFNTFDGKLERAHERIIRAMGLRETEGV